MKLIVVLAAVSAAWSPVEAQSQADKPDAIASYLFVHKNPDYGALTSEDLKSVQSCKDESIHKIQNNSGNKNTVRGLHNAEPGIRELMAAVIERCVRENAGEGLHVTASQVALPGRMLH